MPETPTAADRLDIPEALVEAVYNDPGTADGIGFYDVLHVLEAGAPRVVAAELRRLANVGYWCDDTDISQEVDRALRARADELDPPARQKD